MPRRPPRREEGPLPQGVAQLSQVHGEGRLDRVLRPLSGYRAENESYYLGKTYGSSVKPLALEIRKELFGQSSYKQAPS